MGLSWIRQTTEELTENRPILYKVVSDNNVNIGHKEAKNHKCKR